MTVKRSYVLMGAHLGRALAYVGLTRGSDTNTMFLETDSVPDLELDHPRDEPLTPYATFCRVLARDDDNLTATEVMRAEQAHIDDPQRIRGVYDHVTALLADTRGQWLLDHALPAYLYNTARQSDRFHALLDSIARADALGLDSRALVTAIATNNGADLGVSLTTARDTAAVLRARAELWIAEHDTTAPVDDRMPPPVPSRHPGMDVELADYATELHARLVSHQNAPATATEPPERDPATPSAQDRTPTPRTYRDIPGTTVTHAPFIQASVDTPMPDLATTYQQLADSLRGEPTEPAAGAPSWIAAPPAGDSWDHLLAAQHYAIITERTRRLGELAAAEQPDWTAHLGPRPTRPITQARWDDLAGHIAAYREQFGIDDNANLLGPQPDPGDPHAGAWEQLTQQADRLRAHHAQTTQHSTPETDRDLDRAREEEERRQRMRRQPQHGGPDHRIGPEL